MCLVLSLLVSTDQSIYLNGLNLSWTHLQIKLEMSTQTHPRKKKEDVQVSFRLSLWVWLGIATSTCPDRVKTRYHLCGRKKQESRSHDSN